MFPTPPPNVHACMSTLPGSVLLYKPWLFVVTLVTYLGCFIIALLGDSKKGKGGKDAKKGAKEGKSGKGKEKEISVSVIYEEDIPISVSLFFIFWFRVH